MTDLVERLRERADYEGYPGSTLILQAADEIEQLRERCNPSKVVKIGDVGHYVSEAVYAEIERLQARVTVLDGSACAEEQAKGNGPCGVCTPCLYAQIDQFEMCIQVFAKDAARYRWLRDSSKAFPLVLYHNRSRSVRMYASTSEELDEAIDLAIKELS